MAEAPKLTATAIRRAAKEKARVEKVEQDALAIEFSRQSAAAAPGEKCSDKAMCSEARASMTLDPAHRNGVKGLSGTYMKSIANGQLRLVSVVYRPGRGKPPKTLRFCPFCGNDVRFYMRSFSA